MSRTRETRGANLTRAHFLRAAVDIAAHGDNDTLPFDADTRFVKARSDQLVDIAYTFYEELSRKNAKDVLKALEFVNVFSERLLAPAGPSGFRVVTKIHPFWSIFFNGLSVGIAQALEPTRSPRAHSYRFKPEGEDLFDRDASWRAFRLATKDDAAKSGGVVVQTDISSFYEHVYHHRLENLINDLLPGAPSVAIQVDRLLSRLCAGRSFGLPVGGQGARVLAEVLLSPIDQQLDELNIAWRRYVDDFVIVAPSHADAYRAVSLLSNALADYGLSLNRTKTTFLSARHYHDYVVTQLGMTGGDSQRLLEIDLHFDPYSDDPDSDFDDLRQVVDSLDVRRLLDLELAKSQPDTFLVSQITRTLRLHDSRVALQLCTTLLASHNLHAFRASWSTLMRGIAAVRSDERFEAVHDELDTLLDAIPLHSSHLLTAETSCLHYLRALRLRKTRLRANFVRKLYAETGSETVRCACIDCWRHWNDRASFTRVRNTWSGLGTEEQRKLWYSAATFKDEGKHFRKQVRSQATRQWQLGIEREGKPTFAELFADWKDP